MLHIVIQEVMEGAVLPEEWRASTDIHTYILLVLVMDIILCADRALWVRDAACFCWFASKELSFCQSVLLIKFSLRLVVRN